MSNPANPSSPTPTSASTVLGPAAAATPTVVVASPPSTPLSNAMLALDIVAGVASVVLAVHAILHWRCEEHATKVAKETRYR
jgi:hypothetical protein